MKMATVLVCLAMAGCIPMGPPLSPLIGAAREGDTARMAELLASGADPNGRGGVNHWTPLMHAIHKNQAGSVRVLLDAGADLNARAGNQTALVMAAGYGYADIVKLLLDRGATPTAEALDAAVGGVPDIDRFTVGRCQAETVKALIEKTPSLRLNAGATALRLAKLGGCKDVVGMVERP
ncbi:MAG: hypothetical protein DMG59_12255 [Acidobacteria bacterium]|nr:MAG: hypothetical protein DMG59_12255 [Acidobacteriota bacterium]